MKVGFVSVIREPWGGSEELWAASANQFLKQGISVVISAYNTNRVDTKMQQLICSNAKLIYRRGYIEPGISISKRIKRKIEIYLANKLFNPYKAFFNEQPDIIVYTSASDYLKDDPFFLHLLYKKNIPLILIHQGYPEYIRTFDYHEADILKKAFLIAKKHLFVAQRNKVVMERYLATSIPNTEIIRNPVNLEKVEPLSFPDSQGVKFAIVANLLINHKGQDLVFEILSKKKWKERNWHLNIYGDGIDSEYLKRLSAFYNIEDKITFHGKVNNIKGVWELNHILLMPSRFEGIPLALVEAMLCARPSVLTDVAGHTEWVDEGIEGFIAEGANTVSFDKAMERAWAAKEDWKSIGINAHNKAKQQYDPNPGKTLMQIIKFVCKS